MEHCVSCKNLCSMCLCCIFFLDVCSFTSVTIFSLSRWLWLLLILLGIRSLESEMCLHFEYVTNYLLRLTLRDLAEAFTLLRCCLGQTVFFTGLHSHFDCLYLTRVFQARCEPRKKLKLTMLMSVCGPAHMCSYECMHERVV